MALANLLTLPGHRLPPLDAMLWYIACEEDAEFHVGWDCVTPRTPWWANRIRFECILSPEEDARRLEAIRSSALRQLRGLILETWETTEVNMDALTHWPSLRQLEIRQMNCDCHTKTFGGLDGLSGLVQLSSLNLSGCSNVTDAGLQHLAFLVQLSSLNLTWCNNLTDAGLQHLAGLVQLSSLNLSWCYNLTDAGLQHLAGLVQLSSLNLSC